MNTRWPPPVFMIFAGALFGVFGAAQVAWSWVLFASVPLVVMIVAVAVLTWCWVVRPRRFR